MAGGRNVLPFLPGHKLLHDKSRLNSIGLNVLALVLPYKRLSDIIRCTKLALVPVL